MINRTPQEAPYFLLDSSSGLASDTMHGAFLRLWASQK